MTTAQEARELAAALLNPMRDDDHDNVTLAASKLNEYAALLEQAPVAWMESPHGAIRANLAYRWTAPQSVAWSLPLYAVIAPAVSADKATGDPAASAGAT